MKPERWQEIKKVLAGAMEKAPEDRRAYLDRECPEPDLRRQVESLIAAHEQAGSNFMEPPASGAGPLHPGAKLGPYEIVSPIGAGAMGEVYRARDPKLRRDVAIKVIPPAFVNVPHRLARFQREARLLASLNHPNIAAIYGFEDSDGAHALVMELVEGPTLADRIAQGPIPVDETLPIAKQIAEGLEYAHEHGIVHRDLKPANIKAAPDGTVKILDFGLGKAMETELSPSNMGDSPTVSQMATQEGALLGTATYMSPEQAKARPADRRADIWAFGCVLYEMLTGELAFPGETMSETLAAVLNNEPDWTQLPAATPLPVRLLLRRCLQKDLRQRLQAMGDARIAIEEYLANPNDASLSTSAAVASALPLWRRALPWALAALLALAFAVSLFALLRAPAASAPSATNLDLDMGKLSLAEGYGSHVVISPDGRKVVFLATKSGSQTQQLYLRSLDGESITPLPGTQGAQMPFFSPDGQWVGFSANGKLEKVPLSGRLPVTLCDISGNNGAAATWADNGSIYFTLWDGVKRIPEGGGTPQPVAAAPDPDKLGYVWISSLPGSRGLLLTAVNTSFSEYDIDVLSLETGKSKRLIENGSWPRYLPTGQIIYEQYSSVGGGFTGGLLAVPFDLKSLAVTGSPIPVMEGVAPGPIGGGRYDVAVDGTLVYYPGLGTTNLTDKRLAWLDSKGKVEPLPAPQGNYSNLAISPDGKRAAVTKTTGSSQDIYIYDLSRNTMQRLTFEGRNDDAVFTPDGSQVIYSSADAKGGVGNLWMRAADGSGNAERITTSKFPQMASSVSPDGKLIAYMQMNPKTSYDIYVMPLEGDRKPQGFLRMPSMQLLPKFSPDGKLFAYFSNESGPFQIYVQAFPGPGGKHQISTGGAHNPVWSRNGKKLYYEQGDNLMEVDVTTRPTFSAGTPRLAGANLGITQAAQNFAVAPDGRILIAQRIQQSQQSQQENPPLHVVLYFATEVQNRVAAKQ